MINGTNSFKDDINDRLVNDNETGRIEINEQDHISEVEENVPQTLKENGNDLEEQKENSQDEEDSNVIPPEITLFDLKTKRLQHLFNKEFENFERALTHFKKTNQEIDYKNELIITFWLAVQQSSFEFACFIYKLPDSEFLRKRWTNLIINSFKKDQIDEK